VDYTSTPITATFTAGTTSTTVNVPVTMDTIIEPDETFDLSFTIPVFLRGDVVPGSITTATGTIDDDSPGKLFCYCISPDIVTSSSQVRLIGILCLLMSAQL